MPGVIDSSHPLYSISLKLSRAGDQIKSLTGEIATFLKSNPYVLEIQGDPQTEHLLGVARIKQSCPPMWSITIGEIIHNLRCALDYFVFQLVVLETGTIPPESDKVQFPIFLTEPGFNSRGVPTMMKGVGMDARALIKSLQPFATGEGNQSPLWHLSQLSNWDKHRSISLTGASTRGVGIQGRMDNKGGVLLIFSDGPFKDDTPLFGREVPPGAEPFLTRASKVEMEGKTTFYVAFEEPVTAKGLNVGIALDIIGRNVATVCKQIREEIFKI